MDLMQEIENNTIIVINRTLILHLHNWMYPPDR